MPITSIDLESAANDASLRRQLTSLSLAVANSKRIVVVTGAGISCSCGIPDFRSSDGLYNLVKQQYPDVVLKGRDLFDAALFRDQTSTAVFYTFISGLKAAIDLSSPSPTHHFLQTLHKRGKLLRSYTQNIDGLEERAGLVGSSASVAKSTLPKGQSKIGKDVKNIQLHGDIHRVRCTVCSVQYAFTNDHMEYFQSGKAPDCPECKQRCDERVARSARAVRVGKLRPAIVLYDEPHPLGDDIATIQTTDLGKRPDLLIIMGTSLKVHGLKKLVKEFARSVHQSGSSSSSPKVVFINKTAPAAEWAGVIDLHVSGTTDAWVERVVADWKKNKPADWEVQTTLTSLKVVKPVTTAAVKPKVTRKKADAENVPPVVPLQRKNTATKPATKPVVRKTTKSKLAAVPPSPPLSPSKRQNVEPHYPSGSESDLELSPSKRPRHTLEQRRQPSFEKVPSLEDDDDFGLKFLLGL